jgi:hypothetical protein
MTNFESEPATTEAIKLAAMERVDTAAGTAWLENGGTDWWLVYEQEEGGPQPLGNVFEHGTNINEPSYSWSAGPAGATTGEGVEATREEAVAAVLRANQST